MSAAINNVEADFFIDTDIFQAQEFGTWTFSPVDNTAFWDYIAVPRQANQTVEIIRRSYSTDNNLNLTLSIEVRLIPAPGLINLFAIRIPSR